MVESLAVESGMEAPIFGMWEVVRLKLWRMEIIEKRQKIEKYPSGLSSYNHLDATHNHYNFPYSLISISKKIRI